MENALISPNQVFNVNTSVAHTMALVPSQERILAIDGTHNIKTNNSPFMFGIIGAEEGIASRNLCPRQHMDY